MCKKKKFKDRLGNKCEGKARHVKERNEKKRDVKGKEINVKRR